MTPEDVRLLRICVGANERRSGKLVYELIVRTARSLDLAGASVFPVEMSFGARRHIHDAQSDYGFTDLPVVVEIVDSLGRIEALLSELRDLLDASLVTIEPAQIVAHAGGGTP